MTWMTLTVAAEQLGVDRRTVQRWCREGRIRARRTRGGHWRVTPEALAARPLSVAEAAQELGVSERTVRDWAASGRIAARRLHKDSEWLIDRAAVAARREGGKCPSE